MMFIQHKDVANHYWHAQFIVHGVTLLELLVVVLIIGILSSLIYPSFQNQILSSRRTDGITQLMKLKIQQEAFRLKNPSYASNMQLTTPDNEYYSFSISDESPTTYTLTATAIGSQTDDDDCTTMSINQSMHKTPALCFK